MFSCVGSAARIRLGRGGLRWARQRLWSFLAPRYNQENQLHTCPLAFCGSSLIFTTLGIQGRDKESEGLCILLRTVDTLLRFIVPPSAV